MEFDRSRCYSAINADELHEGDKVLTSNNLASLKEAVRLNVEPSVIVTIWAEMYNKRFKCKSTDTIYDAELAYLVERAENCTNCERLGKTCNSREDDKITCCFDYKPKTEQKAEPHYRPFKDTDELIKVWDAKYRYAYGLDRIDRGLDMPHIWVRYKECEGDGLLLTSYDKENGVVNVDGIGYDLKYLFELFTFLDGSPCGVEK